MIENSVIFISAYIIASVCNNIFFVLFIFSHKMKLLPFSESIIFLTFSSTDFFGHNLCGWESFSSISLSLDENFFQKNFLDFFLQFFCHWMRIQVLPSPKSFIVFVHSLATISSTSSFRNCFDLFFVS